MANRPITIKKINELPTAGAVSGTDVLAIMQGDDTVQTTVTDVTALVDLSGYVKLDGTNQPFTGALTAPAYRTPTAFVEVGFNNAPLGTNAACVGINNQGYGFNIGRNNNTTGTSNSVGGIGFNNTGYGLGVGFNNNSGLDNSQFCIGGNCSTNGGSFAAAIGNQCTATDFFAFSMGSYCNATGSQSFASGFSCQATNGSAFALGSVATATGFQGVSIGYLTNANGTNSLAMGNNSTAEFSATAIGLNCFANGDESMAMGKNLTVDAAAFTAGIMGFSSSMVTNTTALSLMIAYSTTNKILLRSTRTEFNLPIVFKEYTVATLPTGVNYMRAMVSDALAPTFGAAVVGGGAVKIPVYFDGTWKVG